MSEVLINRSVSHLSLFEMYTLCLIFLVLLNYVFLLHGAGGRAEGCSTHPASWRGPRCGGRGSRPPAACAPPWPRPWRRSWVSGSSPPSSSACPRPARPPPPRARSPATPPAPRPTRPRSWDCRSLNVHRAGSVGDKLGCGDLPWSNRDNPGVMLDYNMLCRATFTMTFDVWGQWH